MSNTKISNYFQRQSVGQSENAPIQQTKTVVKAEPTVGVLTKPRQTLGTIQSVAGRGLTRQEEKSSKPKKIVAQSAVLKVYEDPKLVFAEKEAQTEVSGAACPECVAHSTPVKAENGQRTADEEAYELMVQDEPPLEYWKALAEETRSALNDSLVENEQLHSEVKNLQEENERLTDLAKDAEYFAELLQSVTKEEDEQQENYNSDNKSDTEETTASQ